jgi:hypothetical protein
MLKDGLTNPQIAERMGISLDGAKYHVSEIISKLGVSSRQEAALIRLDEHRPWWAAALAPLAWFGRKMSAATHPSPTGLASIASIGLGVAAVGGLALLAFFVVRMMNDDGDGSETTVATNDLADELGASEFMSALDQALANGDEQFFAANVRYREVTCLADVVDAPGNPPACEGLLPGATTEALPVSVMNSEGFYYDPSDYGPLVDAMFKNGSPRLYAVATRPPPVSGQEWTLHPSSVRQGVAIVADAGATAGPVGVQTSARVVALTLGYDGVSWGITHLYLGGPNPFLNYDEPDVGEEWVRSFFGDWERWEPVD